MQWVLDRYPGMDVQILDYGCGSGAIVKELRKAGKSAFGCDVFYEGGDYSDAVDRELLDDGIIKRMEGDAIPFESAGFDVVINNQVMEHVQDLEAVLAEIHRVLRPGGVLLSLFPDKGVWREGHCGIPFLHWFPKKSRPRIYYAAFWRMLGFGYNKGSKSVLQWSRDTCEWLDSWTYYRSRHEIGAAYGACFDKIRHIEDYWLWLRLNRNRTPIAILPSWLQRFIVAKLGCMVFEARKPE